MFVEKQVRIKMTVSVVIPVYNGALSIERLVANVKSSLQDKLQEIILVNDCSSDNSEQICLSIAQTNPEVSFVSLRKNFGEHNAIMCGLSFATGDYVAIIDDDFQNPPQEILKLLDVAESGYDVVFSRYSEKKHAWWRNLGSSINNLVASFVLKKPKSLYLSSFKLIKNDVVQEILKYRGPFPYIDGLILRVTRNIGTCLVEHSSREHGRSNYTFSKLLSLYLKMFLNFSVLPLRVFTVFGFFVFLLGVVLCTWFILERLLFPTSVPLGWASLIVAVITFSGVQVMFLGLIGEYLGKIHLDLNGTPQWVIKSKALSAKSRLAGIF